MQKVDEEYWRRMINQGFIRFLLLKVLRLKDYHGYALSDAINRYSDGFCKPTEGTLYPALAELARGGYIVVRQEKVEGRVRKVYRITEKGKDAVRDATKTWGKLIPLLRKATIL